VSPDAGRVYLVGAGPGDPGLLTARALELIAAADVILHDRLIPAAALDGARADAELLFVGKEGGGASVPQEQTEALMLARAKAGLSVVRLKGGDPFVFGRGGEEALTLRAAGIPFEIVPGVSSGVAAAAYAGIPVTHRGLATAVALVTGHTRADSVQSGSGEGGRGEPGRGEAEHEEAGRGEAEREEPDRVEADIDWAALAAFPGTLVFYMGVRQLPQIAQSLIAAGRPADEPVAIVERGTLPDQRTVTGTLADIAEIARGAEVRAPSITVVGPVAGLAEQLEWLPPRPLSQASGLARRLEELGAIVVQAPSIRVESIDGPAPDLSPYDLVCFTSPNAVSALFERLARGTAPGVPGRETTPAGARDARALAGARVAAIGPGTARALAEHGLIADIVPERFVAEALVAALAVEPIERALIARAKDARDVIPDALRARGAQVDVLALYETVAEPLPPQTLAAARAADYITFTSSSTVRFFLDAAGGAGGDAGDAWAAGGDAGGAGGLSPETRIVSIGPITSETLREHGLEPHVEAEDHDVDGVIQALLADVAGK
jgi:uroporphyrinogen III methyltransferase / synthase